LGPERPGGNVGLQSWASLNVALTGSTPPIPGTRMRPVSTKLTPAAPVRFVRTFNTGFAQVPPGQKSLVSKLKVVPPPVCVRTRVWPGLRRTPAPGKVASRAPPPATTPVHAPAIPAHQTLVPTVMVILSTVNGSA